MKISLAEAGQQASDMTAANQRRHRCQALAETQRKASAIVLDRQIKRILEERIRLQEAEEKTRQAFWLILLPTVFAICFLAYMLVPR
jgi:hypothetical protein